MSYQSEVLADSPYVYYQVDNGVPTFTATASSNYPSEPPSAAVDGNASTYWTTNTGINTGWLRLALSETAVLTDYSIRRRDDIPNRNPKTWTFEGSNDGTTFTVLDTQTGITWPTAGETKKFTFSNTTTYLYYRINITANNGDSYLSIAEISSTVASFQDSSGNSNAGTRSGAMTTLQPPAASIPGHSLLLSGGYILSTIAAGSCSAFTVEAWVKTTSGTGTIFSGRNGSSGLTLQVGSTAGGAFGVAGEVSFGVDGSGLYIGASTTTARVNDGNWHHVVGVWAGTSGVALTPSQFTIYVDGVSAALTARGIAGSATAPLALADKATVGYDSGWSTTLSGTVDEVAAYKGALSAARVSAHYAAGAALLAASLNAVASMTIGGVVSKVAAASLGASATIVAGGTDATLVAAALAASSSIAAAPVVTELATAAMGAHASLGDTAVVKTSGGATLTAAGAMAASSLATDVATAPLLATASLLAGAQDVDPAGATLAASSSLTDVAVVSQAASAALGAVSAVAFAALDLDMAAAVLQAGSAFSVDGEVSSGAALGSAALIASSSLSATSALLLAADVTLVATALLASQPQVVVETAAALSAQSSMSAVPALSVVAAVALVAAATLLASGQDRGPNYGDVSITLGVPTLNPLVVGQVALGLTTLGQVAANALASGSVSI